MTNGHRVGGRIVASVGMVATLTMGVGVLGATPARAAQSWVVDQDADEAPDPGNQCTDAPGDCSLRQAVDAAGDGDTITFAPLVDPVLTLGQIVIAEDLTIIGEGGQNEFEPQIPGTRIDAADASRIFDVAPGADVVLNDMILQRGQAPTGEDGGVIRNAGTLRIERATVTAGHADGNGGGLSSSGSLTVVDVAFSNIIAMANTAPNHAGGDGGAIAASGSLHVERATFDKNTAGGSGGAIAVTGGSAAVVNVTLYRNEAVAGGGAYVGGGGQLSITSATMLQNEGGGVAAAAGASAALEATVLQDNAPSTCAGPLTAGSDTLVWPADSACPAGVTTAATWLAPVPVPTPVNRGFTATVALREGSPAIDAIPAPGGVCSLGAQIDQRTVARPAVAGCDIGAFEAKERLFVGFDPNRTAITTTFADGVERDVPLFVGNGGNRTATGVEVELAIPPGVTVVSVTPPAGTTYDAGTSTWSVGTLVSLDQPALILRLARSAPGDHVVTAVVTSDEPGSTATATLTVHEPVDRYAVPGGPAEGQCLTLATGCAIEYAVEVASQETETVFVAPGEHVVTPGQFVGLIDESLVALDPTDPPTIRGDVNGSIVTTRGAGRLADLRIVNPTRDGILVEATTTSATIERVAVMSGRRSVFVSNGATNLVIRDSVIEDLGTFTSTQALPQTLGLNTSTAVTVENTTVIGRGRGAVSASRSGGHHTFRNVIARDLTGVGLDIDVTAGASIDLSSSNYGTTGGTGTVTPAGSGDNQTAPPVFVDAAGHDFHQAVGSPTVDAGTGTPDADRRDIDFGPRVFGTGVDIGGDELGPIARLNPASHDFGTVSTLATASHTFTLTNVGSAPMAIDSATIVGPAAADYSVANGCGATLAADASCSLTVQFAPTSGLRPATLQVVTDGGTVTAALSGTGFVPDVTPPSISPLVTPPVPASGWHTGSVNVSWSVVDGESTVTSTTGCDAATVSTDGTTTFTCSATSAGGTASQSVTIKRDATVPTIGGSVAPPAPGASGWYVTAPTVSFSCDDATSGVAACSGPTTLGSSASAQSVTGTATDVAGNTATAAVGGLKVDLVDPTVKCGATPHLAIGATGSVSATVTDAHSGPVAGTVSAPANTTVGGSFTAAVTGTDVAGRTTTVNCPYVVERVPTRLVVSPIVKTILGGITQVQPSAVLTRADTGAPIPGQRVTLTLGRGPSCTATTDATGRATCGSVLVVLNLFGAGPLTASYAGTATYQPATAGGTIP